jgi:diphosphomevalonate decarboxylase
VKFSKEDILNFNLRIVSENNFATAAGLASSSSGLSCLSMGVSALYGCSLSKEVMSALARTGSGSACRSIYGGFV